jgi:predicted PurR-regulated permease PerM
MNPEKRPSLPGTVPTSSQAPNPPFTLVTRAVTGLFLLGLLHTLHVARALFLPITLAVLLYLLLIPVVRSLTRMRLREPTGAALVIMLFVGLVGFGVYQLTDPAAEWIDKLPSAMRSLETKLRPMQQSAEQVNEATTALEEVAPGAETAPTVAVKTDWQLPLLHWSTEVAAEIGATLVLLYFLLCSGDFFTHKLLTVMADDEDRQRAGEIIEGIERQLSRFLFHSMVQNAGVAGLFALSLWTLGMPNPGLWGVATLVLQFVPYLGTIAVVGVISVVAAVTFEDLWWAALPGLSYLALIWIKGMFITPVFLGKRLELNPVAVLVGLLLWGWIWDVVGTLLAVPLFATLKIVCDHTPRLQSLGQFLGR